MSGGSLDYAYRKVEDAAEMIEGRAETTIHRAFAVHLHKVAAALHDLEWVWSGDKSPGDEVAAIEALLNPSDVLQVALDRVSQSVKDLTEALEPLQRKE